MSFGVANGLAQQPAVDEFLAVASSEPAALVVEGEPGIGKTTLWLGVLERARERDFIVLSARAAAAESVLAYAALADLLAGIDLTRMALPDAQRVALDRVLLRTGPRRLTTDHRAVGAGLLSVIEALATGAKILVAIDDLQWMDSSSVSAVGFAVRRLSGPVGVIATVRSQDTGWMSWLQLPRPDSLRRLTVPPMTVGALHAVLTERLGRSFSRPTMVRLHEISGGNPLYALELARKLGDANDAEVLLPAPLAELVQVRIGGLATPVQEALLAAACVAHPTVELVARAVGADVDELAGLLDDAERQGIVEIDGPRVRFAHPILARGVYSGAAAGQRRAMHRRLAATIDEPELRARHLALAAVRADVTTLASLDTAADMALTRGAPMAAAELTDLAIKLGGDTPQRKIASATYHFRAGDASRARDILVPLILKLAPGPLRAEALGVLANVRLFDDSFPEAVELAKQALAEAGDRLELRVQTLVTLSLARLNVGRFAGALRSAEEAVHSAEELGQSQLLCQALGMRVMLRFMGGDGLDEPGLRRALELEDQQSDMPVACRPSMQNAQLLSWRGQLDDARREMLAVRRHCVERGQESELMYLDIHRFQVETWRGDFTEAAAIAGEAMERARLLGGDFPLAAALTIQGVLAAVTGNADAARDSIAEASHPSLGCNASMLVAWQTATLGFLELSLGNYEAASTALSPLLAMLDVAPKATEIITASCIPDAIEAFVALDRLTEAERLVERLECSGRRLDRPWMLACGARGRSMLLAAGGDLGSAYSAAMQAMTAHDRLPMPFERARTQLLLGQLQRRERRKGAAATTLRAALCAFDDLGAVLWAQRARTELARATRDDQGESTLTVSERRVAELVAAGKTNRDVAAALFISPKTVEANLSRIYRKLDIRSRTELRQHLGRPRS